MRITTCESDGHVIAAALSHQLGDSLIGLLSATNEAGRELKAFYLLQWDEIAMASRGKARWLDMGGANPEGNPGVYKFKSGVGGEEVEYACTYDWGMKKRHEYMLNILQKGKRNLKKVLPVLGQVL